MPRVIDLFNKERKELSFENIKSSMAYIKIYFEDMAYTEIQETPFVTAADLVCMRNQDL